jgi:hypothetical protein
VTRDEMIAHAMRDVDTFLEARFARCVRDLEDADTDEEIARHLDQLDEQRALDAESRRNALREIERMATDDVTAIMLTRTPTS